MGTEPTTGVRYALQKEGEPSFADPNTTGYSYIRFLTWEHFSGGDIDVQAAVCAMWWKIKK